ncbi:hypothetical protein HHI36_008476 [Cryptolaemus montrouzieri]|uniref:Uncharacterized protein n=1 Tax=Cryptolaemus montrouzieri TaxID=559131 RepID=A0ABD2MSP8_9CUCU
MAICAICTITINNKLPELQCNGICRFFFHANARCSDVTRNQLPLILNFPGGGWTCTRCRHRAPNAAAVTGQGDDDASSAGDGEVLADNAGAVAGNLDAIQLMQSIRI